MDGGAWWAAVHGVARSRTRLSNFTFTFHFHALEKEILQCSCLENPRDGRARWAAIYGVAQSQTQLKQLNSNRASEEGGQTCGLIWTEQREGAWRARCHKALAGVLTPEPGHRPGQVLTSGQGGLCHHVSQGSHSPGVFSLHSVGPISPHELSGETHNSPCDAKEAFSTGWKLGLLDLGFSS